MAGRELQSLALADRNHRFLDAESKIDDAIQIQEPLRKSLFRTKIARGTYALGEGLEKKAYRFFPGLGPQRGLNLWHPVQISRKAGAGDPGYDAAKYNPHTVTYGFDSVTYGGLGVEYNTPNISIRDLRFAWQIKQQLEAVYGYLGNFTNDLWENYHREQYIRFANDASRIFVMGEGGADAITATYDPEAVDSDGDNVLTIAGYKASKIGILDWDWFKWHTRYLQIQAPTANIGEVNGLPTYGWIGDLEDWDKMIENDAELREDWRHHSPSTLIENFGSVTAYKGYSLMHEVYSPRFTVKNVSGTNVVLKRVDPKLSSAAALTGQRADVNPAYLNAEFGMVIIFLKDVFMTEVPPSGPSAPGGGTSFGATPGLNGDWRWLNIQDSVENPLNEMGFWFMRAEAFAKPLTWREEPLCLIYRRFTNIQAIDTGMGGTDALASQDVSVDAVAYSAADVANNTITLTLDGYLTAEANDAISLVDDDAAAKTGIVAESSAAPTYVFALDSAPSAFGKYTAAGGAVVNVV